MQTNRDAQIVHWLGRIGAAAVQHVAKQFGMSDDAVYRRLASLAADGLVERYRLLYYRPSMYVATLAGLRWQGLSRFGGYRPSPSGFEHAWHVAAVAVALHAYLPLWRIVSEREIRAQEADDRRLFASAYATGFGSGVRQHRPDLAVISPLGAVAAVEVERSVKGQTRLRNIARSWARAYYVDHVYYLATPQAARAVRRAVGLVKATDRVTVLDLEDAAGMAAHAAAREKAAQAKEARAGLDEPKTDLDRPHTRAVSPGRESSDVRSL